MAHEASARGASSRPRAVLGHAIRRLTGAEGAHLRLDALERQLVELDARLTHVLEENDRTQWTLVRMAELHGEALQRISDELVTLRRGASRGPDAA